MVRHGDDQWYDIVKWTHFAMIDAEVSVNIPKTVDEAMKSPNPEIKRLVGTEGNYGEQLGLTKRLGRIASSSMSATTVNRLSATSAWARRSRSARG